MGFRPHFGRAQAPTVALKALAASLEHQVLGSRDSPRTLCPMTRRTYAQRKKCEREREQKASERTTNGRITVSARSDFLGDVISVIGFLGIAKLAC